MYVCENPEFQDWGPQKLGTLEASDFTIDGPLEASDLAIDGASDLVIDNFGDISGQRFSHDSVLDGRS